MYLNKHTYKTNNVEVFRDTFSRQGYLLLKNFIDRQKVIKVRKYILKILTRRDWVTLNNNKAEALLPINNIGTTEFFSCVQEIIQEEILHELLNDTQISSFLSNLLGNKVFIHPRKTVRLTYPYHMNKVDYVLPHQDFYYVKGEIDTFTIWIPLGDYSVQNGGLIINDGSHKAGLLPVKPQNINRYRCQVADIDIKEYSWKKANYEIGDVVIMHSLTLHASGFNLSNEMRISVDARYSSSHGYISQRELVPVYYPNIPDWPILSKNWKKKHVLLVPDTVKIQDEKITPEELIKIRTSIFIGN